MEFYFFIAVAFVYVVIKKKKKSFVFVCCLIPLSYGNLIFIIIVFLLQVAVDGIFFFPSCMFSQ